MSYIYGLMAVTCFSLASMVFASSSRQKSAYFVNFFKTLVAFVSFSLALIVSNEHINISPHAIYSFMLSGGLALNIGDLFLLSAFKLIGPGRTLLLFGFQPIIMSFFGSVFLNQPASEQSMISIIFFMACLITFSIENFRKDKSFGIKGLSFALCGMFLDAIGLTLTRHGFDQNVDITSFQANFYRCLGAILGYLILHLAFKKIDFKGQYFESSKKFKITLILGSLLGTFCSLSLYLLAIKSAHVATLTGLAITAPFLTCIFESIYFKVWPSKYLMLAFVFFLMGILNLFKII